MNPVLLRLRDPGDGLAATAKDMIDIVDVSSAAGSRAFAAAVPAARDAEVVAQPEAGSA